MLCRRFSLIVDCPNKQYNLWVEGKELSIGTITWICLAPVCHFAAVPDRVEASPGHGWTSRQPASASSSAPICQPKFWFCELLQPLVGHCCCPRPPALPDHHHHPHHSRHRCRHSPPVDASAWWSDCLVRLLWRLKALRELQLLQCWAFEWTLWETKKQILFTFTIIY